MSSPAVSPTTPAAVPNTSVVNASVGISGSNPFNTSLPESVTGIFSTSLSPVPNTTTDGENFFHHMTRKDETTFVALIIMGVVVPAIFITVFVLICRQRRRDVQARQAQMLLQNAQDFALEDYTSMDKASSPPPRL